jgi:hypothetical protein
MLDNSVKYIIEYMLDNRVNKKFGILTEKIILTYFYKKHFKNNSNIFSNTPNSTLFKDGILTN